MKNAPCPENRENPKTLTPPPHPVLLDAGGAFGRRRRVFCSVCCRLLSSSRITDFSFFCVRVLGYSHAIDSSISIADATSPPTLLVAAPCLRVSGNARSIQVVCRLPLAVRLRLSFPPVRVTPGEGGFSLSRCTMIPQVGAQIRNIPYASSSFKKDNRRSFSSAPGSTPTPLLFVVASAPPGHRIPHAVKTTTPAQPHSLDPSPTSKLLEAVPSTTLRVVLLRQPLRTSLQRHLNSASPVSINFDHLEVVLSTTLCVVLLRRPLRFLLQCWEIQTDSETAFTCSQNPFVGFFNVVFDFFVFFRTRALGLQVKIFYGFLLSVATSIFYYVLVMFASQLTVEYLSVYLNQTLEDFSEDSWKTLGRLLGKSSNAFYSRRRPTKSSGSLPKFFRYELDFGRFLRRLLEDSQKLSEDSWQTS
ncbi:hypothetical protein DY000_02004389 [Brassica cretica]|uniref:Uncharacterized protein n=1 Tax=Brassica cretica TaxID=69181 RepID=A0ABQ7CDD2_BRACR|nr:hypothetical protein DY000_02004389 [Brassica cretica]